MKPAPALPDVGLLPPRFAAWFAGRGWSLRAHQAGVLSALSCGENVLVTAPTGGGKTLAGFLPSLIALDATGHTKNAADRHMRGAAAIASWQQAAQRSIHTLYISPLKALAIDVARNLETPAREMGLSIRIESRTGDTPASRRARQRRDPPDILLTTPEQLSLLLASREATQLFSGLKLVVIDELHALAGTKRGDLLALDLARLSALAPASRRVGLSATVADPAHLRRWLEPQTHTEKMAAWVTGPAGIAPKVTVLDADTRIPWSGHSTRHAVGAIMAAIAQAKLSLVFVNTRSQAEFIFQELWRANAEGLAIALHHGSLDLGQRRKVEAAMARGALRAVVATSTLELGIDWGDVDQVIQVGAPKGASRLTQRIGRSNHRLDAPSEALLVPSNRLEVLECIAARDAVEEGALDGETAHDGALDVLAQHVLGAAVGGPFHADDLYVSVTSAEPYRQLPRAQFDQVLDFVATGGYALKAYERFARLRQMPDGRWRIANPKVAERYRLNIGTIIEAPLLTLRLMRGSRARTRNYGGRPLGQIEEFYVDQLSPGDTFLFGGEVLRFEGVEGTEAFVTRATAEAPKVPVWQGGKFPLSTFLAARVRAMLADARTWTKLPEQVAQWLKIQQWKSVLPKADQLLIETFPRGSKFYLACYPFEGRLAHQTLGMLLTRRLERLNMRPMGFVASEYALCVWGLRDMSGLAMDRLFDEDMLGDDLEAWIADSAMVRRQFRNCAVIAGLIERKHPGVEKSGRQVNFSSDLIFNVLSQHDPGHLLLKAAYNDATRTMLDLPRLAAMLTRTRGKLVAKHLAQVSPLAFPMLLEIGKVPVHGSTDDALLAEAAEELSAEALAAEAMRMDDVIRQGRA